MLEEMIFRQAGVTMFVFLSQLFNVYRIPDDFGDNTYFLVFFSLAFTAITLINYINYFCQTQVASRHPIALLL
jgi:hypothetical protein